MPSLLKSTTVEIVNGTARSMHNNGSMGFLKTDGNWDMYANNSGQVWAANYGWLHDYFFSTVSNCGYTTQKGNGNLGNCVPGNPINCYGGGNMQTQVAELLDNGSQLQFRTVNHNYNCACDCVCTCK